eukprot:COSAG05_NODE_2706_length_2742_cov_4882.680408_2_plen_66_part_00
MRQTYETDLATRNLQIYDERESEMHDVEDLDSSSRALWMPDSLALAHTWMIFECVHYITFKLCIQ